MVDVVTNETAEAQHAATAHAEDDAAAQEMATKAQEAAVQDKPAEVEEPSSEQKQWDDILEETDEVSDDIPEDATPGTEEPKTEVKPAEEEITQEIPAVEPTPAEETPVAEEPKPDEIIVPPKVEEEKTRTPEEVNEEITKARVTAREKLVESYKWTEEQVEQFEEDPSGALSNMAADLFLDLYDSISQGLRGQMPGMVQGMMAQQTATRAAEQQFYGAWPKLNNPEYRATVDRIADTYRQQNPTTDAATAVKEIGAQAWVALRLPLEELMAHTQDVPVLTPAPAAAAQAHVPASAGNAPQSARTPAPRTGNDFENLADELLLDDE